MALKGLHILFLNRLLSAEALPFPEEPPEPEPVFPELPPLPELEPAMALPLASVAPLPPDPPPEAEPPVPCSSSHSCSSNSGSVGIVGELLWDCHNTKIKNAKISTHKITVTITVEFFKLIHASFHPAAHAGGTPFDLISIRIPHNG